MVSMVRRFIPAYAGNTLFPHRIGSSQSVHPRLSGEHVQAANSRRVSRRFIPACAGNTFSGSIRLLACEVHPRLRGEHKFSTMFSETSTGSSPLARGTLCTPRPLCHLWRFIPACAGNTGRATTGAHTKPVHPRLRGEHIRRLVIRSVAPGSSPLARGTREPIKPVTALYRFIPACAGNTQFVLERCGAAPVHPRLRGEHNSGGADGGIGHGSSPLARGTL